MPMFSIYYGDTVERRERSRNTWWNADAAYAPEGDHRYQCDSQLARHLIKESIARGFDIASSNKLRAEIGLGHAFSFVTNDLLPKAIPIVPVMINAFFPPNQPLPGRCYALGKALSAAIKSWDSDRRVAIVASGGLSHFIIDEELDKMVLDALLKRDKEKLFNLPLDRLLYLGNGEALNWIIAAGAVENLKPEMLDYIPCQRTPAGTGCAMAFVQWNQGELRAPADVCNTKQRSRRRYPDMSSGIDDVKRQVAIANSLSREGQLDYETVSAIDPEGIEGSLRMDIPRDPVAPRNRIVPGASDVPQRTPDMIDMKPIRQLINEALEEAQKRR